MYTHTHTQGALLLEHITRCYFTSVAALFRDNRDMFPQEDAVVNKCRQFVRVGVVMVTIINKVYATRYCNLHKSRMAVVKGVVALHSPPHFIASLLPQS